jgi:predicted transcriptional regulator
MSSIERSLVRWVAKLSPWLAPLPSAYFVARSAMEHLQLPLLVAIVIAAIIETLGLSTVHTALWAYEWNSHKRKADPGAPLGLAIGLAGVYLVATLGLVVFLEVWPWLSTYAPALFPALAIVGAVNLALISRQEGREAGVQAQKAEAREQRRAGRLSRKMSRETVQQQARAVQEPVQGRPAPAPEAVQGDVQDIQKGSLLSINLSRQEKRRQLLDTILDIYQDSPEMGATELARALGIGRSTVYTYQEELEETGRLKKNGRGYLVLK